MNGKGKGKGRDAPPAEKPRVKRRTVTEEIVPPDEPAAAEETGGGFEEIDDTRDFTGYDQNLRAYMESGGGVKDYTATLYKYDNLNKQKQYVCNTTQNEILSMHDVGMTFGSGEYRYLVTFPGETKLPPKAFRFNIHPVYDQYRAKEGRDILPDPRGNGGGGKSSIAESLEIIKSVVEIIKPMIPQPSPSADPTAALLQNYGMVKEILKSNLHENVNLFGQVLAAKKDLMENGGGDDMEPEEREPSIVETIFPLIEKFAPLLLGKNPVQTAATLTAVNAIPQVKQTIQQLREPKHRDALKKLIIQLDAKYGAGEINKILSGLKIKRPN